MLEPHFLKPILEKGFRAAWVGRVHEVNTNTDRENAIARLWPHHQKAVERLNYKPSQLWRCEQTHSNEVSSVEAFQESSNQTNTDQIIPTSDGLITNNKNNLLGIYVADCGAIYIADPVKKAVGLLHSGKVGTEKNILKVGIQQMQARYGSRPQDLIICLAPCIRPPAYDIDFAATIQQQALEQGVLPANYHDSQICTTSSPEEYYSYRQELGKTGRMLALLGI